MYKHTKFLASTITPNPIEVSHWIDLNEDTTGGVIKTFDGKQWNKITSDGAVDDEEQLKVKVFSQSDMIDHISLNEGKIYIKEGYREQIGQYSKDDYLVYQIIENKPFFATVTSYAGNKAMNLILNSGTYLDEESTGITMNSPHSTIISGFYYVKFNEDDNVVNANDFLNQIQLIKLEKNDNFTIDGKPVNDVRLNNLYISQAFMNIVKWANLLRDTLIDNVPELSDKIPALNVTAEIDQSTTLE